MKKNYLTTKPLNFNVGLQRWYVKELLKLVDELTQETIKELKPTYKEYKEQITLDASISSQTQFVINELKKKYGNKFKKFGKQLAKKMVGKTNQYANTIFSKLIKEVFKSQNPKGFMLKGSIISPEKEEVMKAIINSNVNYITSIESRYFDRITGAVMRSIENGYGITHIEQELLKYKRMAKNEARNIALDQTRKAYNSINLRNMQDNGIKKFEWLHSGGSQTPRKYHKEVLNGKVFDINTGAPNEKGKTPDFIYPGQEPNCHCRMKAVIEFDF